MTVVAFAFALEFVDVFEVVAVVLADKEEIELFNESLVMGFIFESVYV